MYVLLMDVCVVVVFDDVCVVCLSVFEGVMWCDNVLF